METLNLIYNEALDQSRSKTSPEVELMETFSSGMIVFKRRGSKTSPEVELMETSMQSTWRSRVELASKTSPEVELMETSKYCDVAAVTFFKKSKTSPEVELMETVL